MPTINIRNSPSYSKVRVSLNGDQPQALEAISDWLNTSNPSYYILAGYAGTGKTYLTSAIIKLVQEVSWGNTAVTNPTHQANINLSNHLTLHGVNLRSELISVGTVHSFLGLKEEIDDDGRVNFRPGGKTKYEDGCDLLVCDEVSMIGTLLDEFIEDAHRDFKGKILFVGDPAQIPPIGETDSTTFKRFNEGDKKFYGISWLRSVVRQQEGSKIIGLATVLRNHIELGNTVLRYPQLSEFLGGDVIREETILRGRCRDIVMDPEVEGNPKFTKILAYRNVSVDSYNRIARMLRYVDLNKNIPPTPEYLVGDSLILTSPLLDEGGKQIILPNNSEVIILSIEKSLEGEGDYAYPVYKLVVSCPDRNGGSEVLLKPTPSAKKYYEIVKLLKDYAIAQRKGSTARSLAWMEYYGFIRQYVDVKHSFAITGHRSQGSTYQWSIIDEADIFSNRDRGEGARVAYTSLTRASRGVIILRSNKIK